MSVDNIASYYTNGVEPRSVRTVIAVPAGVYQGDSSSGTAAYSGLFGAGSLITNITTAATASILTPGCVITACGNSGAFNATFASFTGFNVITSIGTQFGVTLPQDSWLQATGTGTVPNLVVSYLS